MIALPVLAVTAAAVVQATSDVDGVDAIPRTMGAAEARISPMGGTVVQAPDPDSGMFTTDVERARRRRSTTSPACWAIARSSPSRRATPRCRSATAGVEVLPTEVDLRNPLTDGLFDLRSGELPPAPGEAVVNDAFAERGVAIGDTLEVFGQDDHRRRHRPRRVLPRRARP